MIEKSVKMKRVLLICVSSQSVINFRKNLILRLKDEGCEVTVVAFDNEHEEAILSLGVDFYSVKDKNRSTNPLNILSLQKKYERIIEKVNPDIVFTFMLKPNIFGVLAAQKKGIENVFSMVEGAGDVFINDSLKWKLIRFVVCGLYKKAFKHSKVVFFLNNDDKSEFMERGLIKAEQCEIIHGVGVDLNRFEFKPIKNDRTFLMVARMLKTKGVLEYCECARIVKKKYPDAVFNYLGAEGTVTLADIKEYIEDGSVNYLGTVSDVRPYLEECTVNVLPSYREGFGLVNAEAAAMGRSSITCDTIGTKETVVDRYSGFLIPPRNSQAIAKQCIYIVENFDIAKTMGENSRKLAEQKFDQNTINKQIIDVLFEERKADRLYV